MNQKEKLQADIKTARDLVLFYTKFSLREYNRLFTGKAADYLSRQADNLPLTKRDTLWGALGFWKWYAVQHLRHDQAFIDCIHLSDCLNGFMVQFPWEDGSSYYKELPTGRMQDAYFRLLKTDLIKAQLPSFLYNL